MYYFHKKLKIKKNPKKFLVGFLRWFFGWVFYCQPYHQGSLTPAVIDSRKLEVNTVLVSVLGVLAGLVLVALILLAVLFTLRRYSKQVFCRGSE